MPRTAEVFRAAWPSFRDRYAELLSSEHVAVCSQFDALYDNYAAPLNRPRCVVHNDFRPDNMLFTKDRLVVIDWQSAALGFNGLDIAYVIGGGFEPEGRRGAETELLKIYHDELTRLGVENYTSVDLEQDYRHFSFAGIVVAVCAAMSVKRTERGDKMFLTMLNRHISHVQDCGGIGLLRDLA
jgi:thiamine kinase-like enzyme